MCVQVCARITFDVYMKTRSLLTHGTITAKCFAVFLVRFSFK